MKIHILMSGSFVRQASYEPHNLEFRAEGNISAVFKTDQMEWRENDDYPDGNSMRLYFVNPQTGKWNKSLWHIVTQEVSD